jgi:hypothetical protein
VFVSGVAAFLIPAFINENPAFINENQVMIKMQRDNILIKI